MDIFSMSFIGIITGLAFIHFLIDIYSKPPNINTEALKKWMEGQENINMQIGKCLKNIEEWRQEKFAQIDRLTDYCIKAVNYLEWQIESIRGQLKCRTQRMRPLDSINKTYRRTRSRRSICLIGGLRKR